MNDARLLELFVLLNLKKLTKFLVYDVFSGIVNDELMDEQLKGQKCLKNFV